MIKKPLFSIIIPVRIETDYLKETQKHLSLQTFKSFELLVITDKISHTSNPAQKRNLGAKMAKGKFLAFLDDDSYPDKNWLSNAFEILQNSPTLAAVCGPSLTPPSDNPRRQASGLVWSSFLGSGGAGTYRSSIGKAQCVDDYPTVNLIVNKTSFDKIGGFNTHHWPGEDTILCLDLVYKLHQKIYYHPSIIVYHHRREVITAHLRQITRYALHRGNFARIYPKTSLKIGYLIPSAFFLYLLTLPLTHLFFLLYIYILLLVITFFNFIIKKNNFFVAIMATVSIPITHIYYGILFIIGFFTKNLDFVPHKTNAKGYIGG
jgi:cellulose synthase/poly-beta-1,6-N-acetylglucosamine synthase-like glycosyltransferase